MYCDQLNYLVCQGDPMGPKNLNTKIIMDSCTELDLSALDSSIAYERIPFKIIIDDQEIIDRNLNQAELIDKMQMSRNKIRTACPSPQDFFDAFDPNAMNYIVTISKHLSGCYNAASIAQQMAADAGFGDRVYVFDSLSAVTGEDLTVLKIIELVQRNLSAVDLIPIVRDYIAHMSTFFVLNSLDNLVRNGRIRHSVALVGKVLKIIPIMMGVSGEIELKEKCRGHKKTMIRLAQIITEEVVNAPMRILAISHVNAPEKALKLKEEIIKAGAKFKEIIILEAGGLSTVYADNGGIVISF